MKSNIIPALIIAVAILAVAFISRQGGTAQVQAVLDQLEQSVQNKDAAGKSQVSRIAAGLSRSVSEGFQQGFQGTQNEDFKRDVDLRQKLLIHAVKIVPGRMKHQEKVIGLLRNDCSETIRNVSLNVVFKNAAGELLDVASRSSSVQGILKPGDELGFEVDRELGNFQEKEEILAQRKAASATINVSGFSVLK